MRLVLQFVTIFIPVLRQLKSVVNFNWKNELLKGFIKVNQIKSMSNLKNDLLYAPGRIIKGYYWVLTKSTLIVDI